MPYGQSPWMDASDAVSGVGQSMSRVALAQQLGRYRAQQLIAQQALEQAYLQLAREKQQMAGRESQASIAQMGAQTGLARARTDVERQGLSAAQAAAEQQQRIGRLQALRANPVMFRSLLMDPISGPQLVGDLRASGVAPQGSFNFDFRSPVSVGEEGRLGIPAQDVLNRLAAAVQGQYYQAAAGSPASAARMTEPIGTGQFDPFTFQQVTPFAPTSGLTPTQRFAEEVLKARIKGMGRRPERDDIEDAIRASAQMFGLTEIGQGGEKQVQEDMVVVTNPQGKLVRIKRSQLEDALKQGYKQ